jgi:uncharacterized protein (DUF4415 family)
LSTTNIKRASLEHIKKMTAEGKVLHPSTTPVGEELPDDFWADAVVVEPKAVKSVHLKIDAEVFDFFKRQGKGHLTRMQDVLKPYVRAKRRSRVVSTSSQHPVKPRVCGSHKHLPQR